jgi:hypothetical protein
LNDLDAIRANVRKQLTEKYRQDFENGSLTKANIQLLLQQLETALVKAKKTRRRVLVEGQEDSLGSLGVAEIEDQIFALKEFFNSHKS